MTLRVIGAGLPRTGTTSLKTALELLLDGPCYHMFELFENESHVPLWIQALDGDLGAIDGVLDGYRAAVDWPASGLWSELADRYPDAKVLLSRRDSAETWWTSVDRTVWAALRVTSEDRPTGVMLNQLRRRFHADVDDRAGSMEAYERHLATVRAEIAPDRLIEMEPGDGWEPLCRALDLPIPDAAYPHRNTTNQFRAMAGWE